MTTTPSSAALVKRSNSSFNTAAQIAEVIVIIKYKGKLLINNTSNCVPELICDHVVGIADQVHQLLMEQDEHDEDVTYQSAQAAQGGYLKK
jgi:hypothetical protein